jgi:hypothetical protein
MLVLLTLIFTAFSALATEMSQIGEEQMYARGMCIDPAKIHFPLNRIHNGDCDGLLEAIGTGDKKMALMHFSRDERKGYELPVVFRHGTCVIEIDFAQPRDHKFTEEEEDEYTWDMMYKLVRSIIRACVNPIISRQLGGGLKAGVKGNMRILIYGKKLDSDEKPKGYYYPGLRKAPVDTPPPSDIQFVRLPEVRTWADAPQLDAFGHLISILNPLPGGSNLKLRPSSPRQPPPPSGPPPGLEASSSNPEPRNAPLASKIFPPSPTSAESAAAPTRTLKLPAPGERPPPGDYKWPRREFKRTGSLKREVMKMTQEGSVEMQAERYR